MSSKEEIKTDVTNRFLKNLRILTDVITRVVLHAMDTTDLIREDENKCVVRDFKDRIEFLNIGLHKLGVNSEEINTVLTAYSNGVRESEILSEIPKSVTIYPGELEEILRDMEKISCCRIKPAYNMLRSYRRASHNLDLEGYNWDKFFEKESDEPDTEKDYRMMITPELRTMLRDKSIYLFTKHTYPYLNAIENRELDFLVNHLSSLFPNGELTDRLSVIFCTDENGTLIPKYINERDIDYIWKIVQGCVKNGLMYCYLCDIKTFDIKIKVGKYDHPLQRYTIDYAKEFKRWKMEVPVF